MALNLSKSYTPVAGEKAVAASYNIDIATLFNAITGLETQTSTLGGLTITPSTNSTTTFKVTDASGTTIFDVDTTNGISTMPMNLPDSYGVTVALGTSHPDHQATATATILNACSATVSKRLNSVNVTADIAASGANGLDTGSEEASKWYAFFVIHNPTTSTTAGMFSLSPTAPTMPTGYTLFRRVGYVLNNASSNFTLFDNLFNSFQDRGNITAVDFTHSTLTIDGVWHDMDLSAICPPGTKSVLLRAAVTRNAPPSNDFGLHLKTKGNANDVNTADLYHQVSGVQIQSDLTVAVDANRFIQYNSGIAYDDVKIAVSGWWK